MLCRGSVVVRRLRIVMDGILRRVARGEVSMLAKVGITANAPIDKLPVVQSRFVGELLAPAAVSVIRVLPRLVLLAVIGSTESSAIELLLRLGRHRRDDAIRSRSGATTACVLPMRRRREKETERTARPRRWASRAIREAATAGRAGAGHARRTDPRWGRWGSDGRGVTDAHYSSRAREK